MRFGILLEEIKNDGWTTFWQTLEMVEASRTRTDHFSTYGLRMCCKGMSMLLGLFSLVMCVKYQDVMEGIKVCDESNDTLTFCFDKKMQQFAQCVDKLFRFNANSILFYQTQLWFQKELLVGCFVDIVVFFIISGTLLMTFFGYT